MATQFGYMVAPVHHPAGWWYYGQTAEQVGQLLTQNNAMLTNISTYLAVDNTLRFAVIMEPADGRGWWWYIGQWTNQVAVLLAQDNAMLTRVRAYIDVNHTRNLAVIMVPGNQKRWLYVDQSADQVRDLLAQNNATLMDLSAYPGPLDSVRFALIWSRRPLLILLSGEGRGWMLRGLVKCCKHTLMFN